RRGRDSVDGIPRFRRRQPAVYVLDVFDALVAEPVFEGLSPMLAIYGDRIFPRRASAQDAGKIDARFRGKVEGLGKCIVTHAGGEIDERLFGDRGSPAEMFLS